MTMFHRKILPFAIFMFGALFVMNAEAATMYLSPSGRTFGINQELSVEVKVNTEEAFINAAEATVRFPAHILEAVDVDRAASAFNFWVEDPEISNEEGTVRFIGGTTKGISGDSLHVLKMKFRAKGVGSAEFSISDAAATASDGKGTNVLSAVKGTTISVGAQAAASEPVPAATPDTLQPQKVVREAVPAKSLPKKPEIRVQLYPDEARWYNYAGDMVVFWSVPDDVTEIATALDRSPTTKPGESEKELLTGKNFGALNEGVSYIHVRFRNGVGWSEAAHYKISLDTTPPLPFEIEADAVASEHPAPNKR